MSKNIFADDFNDSKEILTIDVREKEKMIRNFLSIVDPDKVDIRQLPTSDYMIGKVGFERKRDDITNLGDVVTKCTELKSQFPIAVLIVERSFDECLRLCITAGVHRNQFIGMTSSLIARGIIPLFVGKRRNLVDLILSIGVKCNDDKDRTYIEPLRPGAKTSDYQIRALKNLGLGQDASRRLLLWYGSPAKVLNSIRAIPFLDKETLMVMGIGGMGAKLEKAITILESEYDGGS